MATTGKGFSRGGAGAAQTTMGAAFQSAQGTTGGSPDFNGGNGTGAPKRSLMGMLGGATLMSAASGSAALGQMRKIVDALLAGVNKSVMDAKVINLDHEQGSNTYYSGMLVMVQLPEEKKAVAYYYVMLAGSRELPKSETITEQNVRFERLLTPGELCDQKLIETLQGHVQASFPGCVMRYAGTGTLPATFEYGTENSVRMAMASAVNACGSELQLAYNLAPRIMFSEGVQIDAIPEISVNMNRGDITGQTIPGADGMPVRADTNLISTLRSLQSQANQSWNGTQSSRMTAKITGFSDVHFSPIQQTPAMIGMPHAASRCLAPYYVITSIATDIGYNPNTLALAIDSAMALTTGNRFMQAYMPSPGQVKKNRIDTKNFGALNVLANVVPPGAVQPTYGPVMSTSDAGFTNEKFVTYMNTVIRTDAFNIAVDCPVNSCDGWPMSIIDDAARGHEPALNRFLDGINELTGGRFNMLFDRTKHRTFIMSEAILAGTYIDGNGQKRDLRDIDLIWVCNTYGNSQQSEIFSWLKTFAAYNNGISSQAMCLDGRRKMTMALTQDTANITGIINRHFFNGVFLSNLRQALHESGYNPAIVSSMSTLEFNNTRPVADFVSQGIAMGTSNFGGTAASFQNTMSGNTFRGYN